MILRTKTAMLAGCFAALVACSEPDTPAEVVADGADVAVLSSAPDQISGGTVLLALSGENVQGVVEQGRFQVAGRDLQVLRHTVRPALDLSGAQPDEMPVVHEILLAGLDLGINEVDIQDAEGQLIARLTLTNHPASGPVFSGPQQ